MTVNILIITHDEIGQSLLVAAINTLGFCPLSAELLPIQLDSDPDKMKCYARDKVESLNDGEDVLILTDIFGSTPGNIACSLLGQDNIRVVSGVNLPMLIRVFNYPSLDLDELVVKAVSGGKEGIMDCDSQLNE